VQPSTCRQATWKDSVDTRRAEAVFIRFLGTVNLPEVSQRFNLTQRERDVLEYLLQGLDSKAIANRMNISPNTVKTFLRLIMTKTGVSSRSAVVAKIIMSQP